MGEALITRRGSSGIDTQKIRTIGGVNNDVQYICGTNILPRTWNDIVEISSPAAIFYQWRNGTALYYYSLYYDGDNIICVGYSNNVSNRKLSFRVQNGMLQMYHSIHGVPADIDTDSMRGIFEILGG